MKKRYILTALISATLLGLAAGCGSGKDIGEAEAKKVALENAGVQESDATRIRVSKDRDDGMTIYDVQFDVNEKEYDYEINAKNGEILSSDVDTDENYANQQNQNGATDTGNTAQNNNTNTTDDTQQQNTQTTNNANVKISEADAKKAALDRVPGASETDLKMELEFDDGKYTYEGDIIYQQKEYEFEIDANTGTFLKWSEENL
ncbi:MAG: PepSY domain-containing protein [Sellimonas sp.]|uniref:PepSY domain-containing protein n=1 Tax=Sellimonas sp. TaxID=2021466 RepID=UPI0039A0D030